MLRLYQGPQAVHLANRAALLPSKGVKTAPNVAQGSLARMVLPFVSTVRSAIMRIRLEARPVPGALLALQRPE